VAVRIQVLLSFVPLQGPICAVALPASKQPSFCVICQPCFSDADRCILVVVVVEVTVIVVVVIVVTVVVMVVTVVEVIVLGNVVVGSSVVCSSVVVGNTFSPVVDPTATGTVVGSLDSVVALPSVVPADVLGSVLVLSRAAEVLLVLSAAVEVLWFSVIGTPPLLPVVVAMPVVLFGLSVAAIVVSATVVALKFDDAFATAVVSVAAVAVVVFGSIIVSESVVASVVDGVETGRIAVATVVVLLVVGLRHGFVHGAVELAVEVLGALTRVVVVVGGTVSTRGPELKIHFCCSLSSSQGCMETGLTSGLSGVSSCRQWLSSSSPSCSKPVGGSNLQCWLAPESLGVVHGQM